jgi:hypothetical protein
MLADATQRGTVEKLRDDTGAALADKDAPPAPKTGDAVTHLGLNLHASVRIEAHEDLGRGRLFRYALRPPFALSRLRRLTDGRMAYRVKSAGYGKARCRVS